jgi:ankyrin repeat protein
MYQEHMFDYLFYHQYGLGTPLFIASKHGYLDVVKVLVENGANPFIQSSRGDLPVDIAEQKGYLEVAGYLRSIPFPVGKSVPHFVDSHLWKDTKRTIVTA